jgi:hypothetical protein
METKDELLFLAAMALVGLVIRGESPKDAAQMAQQYAQAMADQLKL